MKPDPLIALAFAALVHAGRFAGALADLDACVERHREIAQSYRAMWREASRALAEAAAGNRKLLAACEAYRRTCDEARRRLRELEGP